MKQKHIRKFESLSTRLPKQALNQVLFAVLFKLLVIQQLVKDRGRYLVSNRRISVIPYQLTHQNLDVKLIQDFDQLFMLTIELNLPRHLLLIVHPGFKSDPVLKDIPMELVKHDVSSRIADAHTQSHFVFRIKLLKFLVSKVSA